MTNRIILTNVGTEELESASAVSRAVPFTIGEPNDPAYLGISTDGTIDGTQKFTLSAFGNPQIVTAPEIVYPSEGTIVNPIVTIESSPWTHLYRRAQKSATLEIYTDAQLANCIHCSTHYGEVASFPFGPYELPGLTTLYVRVYKEEVAPSASDAIGEWSNVVSFTTMSDPYIYTPAVVSCDPRYSDDDSIGTVPTFTSSEFMFWGVTTQAHVSTIWRLTNLSTGKSVDKVQPGTTITWDAQLDYATQYSIMCMHTGDTLRPSEWSEPILFTTECEPHINIPIITFPTSGSDIPYFYIQIAPPTAYHRTATHIATRFIIKDKITGTVYQDVVRVLPERSLPEWEDPHLGTTEVVNDASELLWKDFGPMSGSMLSSNPDRVPIALGRDMIFLAYTVDANYGVSTTIEEYPNQVPSVETTVTPTTVFYYASITSPPNGASGISISPTIVSEVTPRVWTYPAGTWSNSELSRSVAVVDSNNTTLWTADNASASAVVTVPLPELSTFNATLNVTDEQFGITVQYDSNSFNTNDVYMAFANPAGGILPWFISPTSGSTISSSTRFKVPQPTFVNVPPSTLSVSIDSVTWKIIHKSSGSTVASYVSLAYEYAPAISFTQNTTYTISVTYSTNHPEYIPDLTLSSNFTTESVIANPPYVTPATNISPSSSSLQVTVTGITNSNLLPSGAPRVGTICLQVYNSSFTSASTFYYYNVDMTYYSSYSVSISNLYAASTYYARAYVASGNEQYIYSSSTGSFAEITTAKLTCGAPSVTPATNISRSSGTVQVTLTGVTNSNLLPPGAPRTGTIRLEMSTSSSFSSPSVFYYSNVDMTSYYSYNIPISGLVAGTTYYSRACVTSGNEQYIYSSPYGSSAVVTTAYEYPALPTSISIYFGYTVVSSFTFRWMVLGGSVYDYAVLSPMAGARLEISTTSNFSNIVYTSATTIAKYAWSGVYYFYPLGYPNGPSDYAVRTYSTQVERGYVPTGFIYAPATLSYTGNGYFDNDLTPNRNGVTTDGLTGISSVYFSIPASSLPAGVYYVRGVLSIEYDPTQLTGGTYPTTTVYSGVQTFSRS